MTYLKKNVSSFQQCTSDPQTCHILADNPRCMYRCGYGFRCNLAHLADWQQRGQLDKGPLWIGHTSVCTNICEDAQCRSGGSGKDRRMNQCYVDQDKKMGPEDGVDGSHTIACLSVPCSSSARQISRLGIAWLTTQGARIAVVAASAAILSALLIANSGVIWTRASCGLVT